MVSLIHNVVVLFIRYLPHLTRSGRTSVFINSTVDGRKCELNLTVIVK